MKRGACPSLRAPMQTGDGLLVRLSFTDGVAPMALQAVAALAGRFGNGLLEMTARGNLQIRGLDVQSAEQLAEAVEALDLPLRSGVPVETGPLAGLDPEAWADPQPLARQIAEAIADEGLSTRLGPKVSVIIEGGGRLRLDDSLADIRLEALPVADAIGWRLSTGGTARTAVPRGIVRAGEAVDAVLTLLRLIAIKGPAARAGDLSEAEACSIHTKSCAGPSVCPGLDPGPINTALSGDTSVPVSRIKSGARAERFRPNEPHFRIADHCEPVGLHALVGQRYAIGLGLPFGQTRHDRFSEFMQAAQAAGATEIRLAARALLAICPTRASAEALQDATGTLGFVTDRHDLRLAITACAGAPVCGSGQIATKAIAAEICASTDPGFSPNFRLHISGCEKRCAGSATSGATIVGHAGGTIFSAEVLSSIIETPANKTAEAAIGLARRFRTEKSEKSGEFAFATGQRGDSVADPIHQARR